MTHGTRANQADGDGNAGFFVDDAAYRHSLQANSASNKRDLDTEDDNGNCSDNTYVANRFGCDGLRAVAGARARRVPGLRA